MGDWDYEDNQAKLNHPQETDPNDDDTEDVDLSDIEDDADEDEDELEDEEEAEVTEDKDKTEKVVPDKTVTPDDSGLTIDQKTAIRDEIISRVGEDTILKIRGVQKRAGDLSPEEFVVALQKGIDADNLYKRLSTERRQLETDRALVEKGAATIQHLLEENARPKDKTADRRIPDILRSSPDDTPEVKAWKEAQLETLDKVNAMEQYLTRIDTTTKQKAVVDNVIHLRETYPMASADEVLAVLDVRPDINAEELMRASHDYYTSSKFLDSAIAANPTYKREYEQKVIRNYINTKKGVKTLPGKRQAATRVERLDMSSEKPTGLFDFDVAENLSNKYMKQIRKLELEG